MYFIKFMTPRACILCQLGYLDTTYPIMVEFYHILIFFFLQLPPSPPILPLLDFAESRVFCFCFYEGSLQSLPLFWVSFFPGLLTLYLCYKFIVTLS